MWPYLLTVVFYCVTFYQWLVHSYTQCGYALSLMLLIISTSHWQQSRYVTVYIVLVIIMASLFYSRYDYVWRRIRLFVRMHTRFCIHGIKMTAMIALQYGMQDRWVLPLDHSNNTPISSLLQHYYIEIIIQGVISLLMVVNYSVVCFCFTETKCWTLNNWQHTLF